MAGSSFGVTYLTLAYLIEIAVVLNLAYRELKFPDLDNKLHDRVRDALDKANKREIDKKYEALPSRYREYGDLKALIVKNGENDESLWGNMPFSRKFFNKYIRTRRSLNLVNKNILGAIFILIGCTAAAGILPPIEDVYYLDDIQKIVWVGLLLYSIYITCQPLIFIRMATLCEKHLLGFDNKSGLVQKLAGRMFNTVDEDEKEAALKAAQFKVRP